MRTLNTRRKRVTALIGTALAASILLTAGSCDTQESSQSKEAAIKQGGYDKLTASQKAHVMNYSPTRDTINFWIDTWGKPNKLSYVYLQNANGDLIGYYVLKGLPVSYCAALTPTYQRLDAGGSDAPDAIVPAPGVDGVYYSGGQCNTYYGRDATSSAYIEYTVGLGINVLLYDKPLPPQELEKRGNPANLSPTAK